MVVTKSVVGARDGVTLFQFTVFIFYRPRHVRVKCVPDGDTLLAADRSAAQVRSGIADGVHVSVR